MTTAAWAQLEPAISAVLKAASGVGSVTYDQGTKPSVAKSRDAAIRFTAPSNGARLEWTVRSIIPVGKDELRTEYRADVEIPGDTYEPDPEVPATRLGGIVYSQHSHTIWTIEIRCESTHGQRPAIEYGRALFAKWRLPSVRDAFTAVGLAVTGWTEIGDDTYEDEHGAAVTVWIGEITCNGAGYAEDLPVTTIERYEIAANVTPADPPSDPP